MGQFELKVLCLSWLSFFLFVFLWTNRRDFLRHLNRFPKPEDERWWSAKSKWGMEEILLLFSFYAIPFGYSGMFLSQGGAGKVTIAKLFLLGTMLIWLLKNFFVRKDTWFVISFVNHRSSVLLLLFLVANVLSLVNSVSSQHYFAGFMQTALIAVLYFLVVSIVRYKRKVLLWVIYATIIGSVWSALGGVYEVATGDLILKGKASSNLAQFGLASAAKGTERTELIGGGRIGGFSGNPGGHGTKYAVWASLALCLPLIAKSWKGRALGIGYIVLAFVNVFGSGCKTAIMGLFSGLVVFFLLGDFRKKWVYVCCLVLGVILIISLLPPELKSKVLHQSNASKGALELRYPQYKVAYHMIVDHPIIGVGTGNFNAHTLRYAQRVPSHDRVTTAFIHNGYLQIWSETGTLGFVLFLAFFGSGGATLITAIRFAGDRQIREISVSILAAWTCWLVILVLYPTVMDEFGWVLVGMSTCIVFILQKERSEKMDSQAVPA